MYRNTDVVHAKQPTSRRAIIQSRYTVCVCVYVINMIIYLVLPHEGLYILAPWCSSRLRIWYAASRLTSLAWLHDTYVLCVTAYRGTYCVCWYSFMRQSTILLLNTFRGWPYVTQRWGVYVFIRQKHWDFPHSAPDGLHRAQREAAQPCLTYYNTSLLFNYELFVAVMNNIRCDRNAKDMQSKVFAYIYFRIKIILV